MSGERASRRRGRATVLLVALRTALGRLGGKDMQDQPSTQIIIRHVGGAKVNKIEQFPLAAAKEITFGRDVRSTVAFDSQQDDPVSRKHAVLKVKSEEPLAFAVADLNSSNGTFVN